MGNERSENLTDYTALWKELDIVIDLNDHVNLGFNRAFLLTKIGLDNLNGTEEIIE